MTSTSTPGRFAGAQRRRAGRPVLAPLGWIVLIVLAAALAGLLPIPSPTDMDMLDRRAPPSAEHLLGTDQLGRDVLSRLIHGARISLTVGLLAPVIGVLIGGSLGMLAGYFRGRFETLTVGGVDVLLAFPPLVFALAVTAYLGQSVQNMTLVIGVLGIPAFTRVARAVTLSLSRARVRRRRARARRHPCPHPDARAAAQRGPAAARLLPARRRRHHRRRGRAVLPRARRAAAGAELGQHDRRGPREPRHRAVARLSCRPGFMFVTVLAFNLVGDTLRALTDPRPGAL